MELLTSVFRQLLSMSLTALPVMAVVLAARLLLGRAPKRFRYLLWAVVAFRLVCPVSFTSPVGLVEPGEMERRVETAGESYVGESRVIWNAEEQAEDFQRAVEHGNQPVYGGENGYYVVTKPDGVSPADTIAGTVLPAASILWLTGMAAVLAYGAGTYVRLRRRVAAAVWREENVWKCDSIPTPFVLGFVRLRIYIPFRLSEEERLYVLAHERYHIRHLDHWVKLLGYLLLAVYWWNPAVWLCWVLCCRDMEMRCDEAVLAQLGDRVKTGYSLSLVSFALDRRASMALAFGEHDAARRVKNVLNWKRAGSAAVFLAVAAVALVAVVCGTDAEGGSWLEAEQSGNAVSFTCEMKEPIRSWAIYEDIYENGELISSSPCIMDSFQDDGGASPRELRTTLSVPPVYEMDGFSGELAVSFGFDGAGVFFATRNITLPRDRYTGMGSVLGDGSEEGPARWKLEDDGSVALYTVMFSTRPDGGIRAGGTAGSGLFDNDTVLQYRFVTSTLSMGELTADSSLARTLFALRTDSAADTEAVDAILEALGMDAAYTLEFFEGHEDILLIRCAEEPKINMSSVDALLRALVGDIRQAGYAYLKPDGSTVYVNTYVNADSDWLEEAAQRLGYRNVKEMGKTAAGIRALLDYLGWEEQADLSSDPLDKLARTLFSLRADGGERPDVKKLLDVLDTDALGSYTVTWRDDGTAQVAFDSLYVGEGTLRLGMQKRAAVMMGVCPELRVSWSYEDPESGMETAESADALARNGWTISLGTAAVSEETAIADIRDMLVRLDLFDRFALLQRQEPAGAFWQLLNDGLWDGAPGDLSLSGMSLDGGVLTLDFADTPRDPSGFDVYLARTALVLLYVKPEVRAVSWAYPGADGAAVERRAARSEMWIITSLFSGFDAGACPVTSQAGLYRLVGSANLDGRVYQLWMERSAGPETSVSHTARQMFELAQEDTPDALAEDLLCWDIWGDPAAAGAYTQTVENGRLELVFQDSSLWEENVLSDYRMARNGCLLLALRPELDMVLARDADRTSYMRMTRETAARILTEGKAIGDYGASPEMLMELIALLENDAVFAGRTERLEFYPYP